MSCEPMSLHAVSSGCRKALRDGFQASMSTTASIVPGAFPSSRLFTNRNAGFFRRIDSPATRRIPSRAPSFGSRIGSIGLEVLDRLLVGTTLAEQGPHRP